MLLGVAFGVVKKVSFALALALKKLFGMKKTAWD